MKSSRSLLNPLGIELVSIMPSRNPFATQSGSAHFFVCEACLFVMSGHLLLSQPSKEDPSVFHLYGITVCAAFIRHTGRTVSDPYRLFYLHLPRTHKKSPKRRGQIGLGHSGLRYPFQVCSALSRAPCARQNRKILFATPWRRCQKRDHSLQKAIAVPDLQGPTY